MKFWRDKLLTPTHISFVNISLHWESKLKRYRLLYPWKNCLLLFINVCCGISRFRSWLWSGVRILWDYKKFTYFIYTCTSMKLPLNNTITCNNFEKWFILVNHLSTNICFNKALNFIFLSQGFKFLICSPPVRREVVHKSLIRDDPKCHLIHKNKPYSRI